MNQTLQTIATFISKHHVMTLATARENVPQACTLFYAYLDEAAFFVVASDPATEHMGNVARDPRVAANIALETKEIGRIEGVQIKGIMRSASGEEERAYFKAFPFARAMRPMLWTIEARQMKLTDNRLGFGKKLTWRRAVSE